MATYYVVTYRPPYPERGVKHVVYHAKNWSVDVMPPSMTSTTRVDNVRTKEQALAVLIEHAAGLPVTVTKVFPRRL